MERDLVCELGREGSLGFGDGAGSGSKASSEAASVAMPRVRRPSPQPSNTRWPSKSASRRSAARCAPSGSSVCPTWRLSLAAIRYATYRPVKSRSLDARLHGLACAGTTTTDHTAHSAADHRSTASHRSVGPTTSRARAAAIRPAPAPALRAEWHVLRRRHARHAPRLHARQQSHPADIPQEVASVDEAEQLRFLGSPTVRVNGHDVEPGADSRTDFTLACRIYRTASGHGGTLPRSGCGRHSAAPERQRLPETAPVPKRVHQPREHESRRARLENRVPRGSPLC